MTTETLTPWKPGADLPYVISRGERGMLAISLSAAWVKPDRTGQPLLLPPAVRAIDRLRAVFADSDIPTPGFVVSLREAMRMTQSQFGRRLGVSKMTVSRWECGRMRPGPDMARALRRLQTAARRQGVKIDGERHAA